MLYIHSRNLLWVCFILESWLSYHAGNCIKTKTTKPQKYHIAILSIWETYYILTACHRHVKYFNLLFLYMYTVMTLNVWVNSVDPEQTPQNHLYQALCAAVLDASTRSKMNSLLILIINIRERQTTTEWNKFNFLSSWFVSVTQSVCVFSI